MVRLSLALFALAGFASASASGSSHNARSAAHNKMVKVRNASAVPPVDKTSSSNANVVDGKEKRDDGLRFTYYITGLGACGSWSNDTDYVVALNAAQWNDGEHCYETINISYSGKQTQATIVDKCPGCPEGGLDFSPSLFQYFDELSVGVLYGNWSFN